MRRDLPIGCCRNRNHTLRRSTIFGFIQPSPDMALLNTNSLCRSNLTANDFYSLDKG